jgi:hypothetical protein
VGTSAGDTDATTVAAVTAATVAVHSRCGLVAIAVSCGGSLNAAMLTTAHGALDERHLVGTAASGLSTLAAARAGTVSVAL